MSDTKTLSHPDTEADLQTTFRWSGDLKLRTKIAVATHGVSQNQLLTEGLELRLAQLERKAASKR